MLAHFLLKCKYKTYYTEGVQNILSIHGPKCVFKKRANGCGGRYEYRSNARMRLGLQRYYGYESMQRCIRRAKLNEEGRNFARKVESLFVLKALYDSFLAKAQTDGKIMKGFPLTYLYACEDFRLRGPGCCLHSNRDSRERTCRKHQCLY